MPNTLSYYLNKGGTNNAATPTIQANKKNMLSYYVPAGIKEKKNTGDPITYAAANIGLGVAGVIEGMVDLKEGIEAQLNGDKGYAEYVHKNSVVGEWKKALDKQYNPGKAMTFIGDVGQGLGQSSVMLLDAVAPGVGTGMFFAGVAGGGVSEAVQTTGELGAKEYIYGGLSGAMEATLEKVVGGAGQAVSKITGKAGGSVVGKVTSKIAADAVWKGVTKDMISSGAGEFVEEFLSEYGNVALKRVTGVDKDAETTLGQAMYSGLVGFASGGVMGGSVSAISTAASYKRGSKVVAEGNADTLVKTASYVADSFKTDKESRLPEALSSLKKTIKDYSVLADKNAPIAKVKLGEMQAYMTMVEVSQGVADAESKILSATDEAVDGYAKVMSGIAGKTYTAADIKANKDNITTRLAAMSWAGAFLSDTKAERDIKQYNQIIETDRAAKAAGQPAAVADISTSAAWDGGDAVYSAGDDYIKVTALDGDKYSITYGQDAENVRGFASKSKEEVKSLLERSIEAMTEYERARTDRARAESNAARAAMQVTVEPQSVEGVTIPAQAQTATETDTATPTEAASVEDANTVPDVLAQVRAEMNTGELAQNKYTATEQDAARKVVKDFDVQSADTRRAVLEWVRSAKGVDKDIVSAVSFIISVRPGLQVIHSKIGEGHKGLYAKLPNVDRRLIVTSGDAAAVRETLVHELVHDMRDSKGWDALRDTAMEAVSEDEKSRIAKMYRDTLGLDDATIEEEIVAKTVGKMLVRKPFLERYAETGKLKQVINAAKSLFEYIKSKGPDRITLMETARIIRLMDGIIASDYVKGRLSGAKVEKRYNLDDIKAIEQAAKSYFGSTYSWKETGYITTDGTRLDFSGKKDGARAGQRSMDHREILEAFGEDANISGTEAMIRFMSAGNVRIMPESGGINLSVRPTKAQEDMIARYAETFRGEIIIDFDDTNGDTKASVEYPKGTRSSRVIQDIRNYFDSGIVPEISDVQRFRYNLDEDSEGNKLTPEQQEFFKDSKVRDKRGRQLVMYHQTDAEFTVFDTNLQKHSAGDFVVPKGIFLKDHSGDIGLGKNKIQMEVYANITNPLVVKNREVLLSELEKMSGVDVSEINKEIDKKYSQQVDAAHKESLALMIEKYHKEKAGDDISGMEAEIEKLLTKEESLIEKWTSEYDNSGNVAREKVKEILKENGYDGVIIDEDRGSFGRVVKTYIALESSQVKLTTNKNPTADPDIRYNLDETKQETLKHMDKTKLTERVKRYQGQADYWRNQTKRTTAPSVDVKAVAAKARELRGRYNSKAKDTKARLQDLYNTMAQQAQLGNLDGTELYEKALSIAEGIISESYQKSPEYETYQGIRAYVYSNKLNVRDAVKSDFEDWSGWVRNNIPFVVRKNGISVETAYAELAEIYGEAFFPADIVNPAEQLRHIAQTRSQAKDKMEPALFEDMQSEARNLANTILGDFLDMPYAKPTFADKQANKIDLVKASARVSADADRARNVITKRKTKGILGNDEYNSVLEAARRVKPRYEIIPAKARVFADAYIAFLEKHAPEVMLAAKSEEESAHKAYHDGKESNQILQYIDPDTVRELLKIKKGEGALTARELNGLHAAYTSLLAMDGRVDKMYVNDKWVDVAPKQTKIMAYLHDHYGGKLTPAMRNELNKKLTAATMYALDPEDVTKLVEGVLSDGLLSKHIHELKLAEEKANFTYDKYTEATEKYMRDNKDFFKAYNSDTVKFTYTRRDANGNVMLEQELNITKGEAMQLYMTVKREQAKLALALGRVRFSDSKRSGEEWKARIVEAAGEKWYAGMTEAEFESNARRMAADMEKSVAEMSGQFSEQDKEFIKLMEDYYNRQSKEDKKRMDDILWGKTNVIEGYYVPISRSEMSRELNLIEPRTQEMSVRSLSFNKNTVQGANAQLVIGDAYDIMKRHAKQMSRYVHMTIPLMNFQRLYNHTSEAAVDKVYTIREYLKTYGWEGYEKYITDYFQDAQGLRKAKEDGVNRVLRSVKGATAKYYIGANIGSMAKQMSSVLMMSSIVSREAWVRGIKPINADKIDTYSVAAANRNSESAMYYAQGVQGTLGKVGNVFMTPMKWGDRGAVQLMWSMVQHEVAIKEGLALGTEENLKRAGQMLDDAILAVQDTGSATTKTGIARHPQELVSAFSMFRSAPSKMFSRLYMSGVEMAEVTKRKKQGKEVPEAVEKKAVKKMAVLSSAILTVALYESIVGLIRNSLRGKDEEEEVLKTLAEETALSVVGLVPVAGQIAENWLSGYDVSLFHLDMFNDTKKALDGVVTMSDKMISGEYVDDETIRKNARNVVYAAGRLTGIPTKNLHNIIMSALSPSKAAQYKANALFTDVGMTSTLQKAVEGGDDRLAQTVISNLYNKRTGAYSAAVSNKIAELYAKGYTNVLAVNLPTTYKDTEGNEQKVTAKQYKAMEAIYSQTNTLLSQMITDSRFLSMGEEAQAKAISVAFRAYHNKAKSEVLGAEKTQTVALMGIIDPLTLFIEGAYIATLPSATRAEQAKARVSRYDELTQAALLYANGYKSVSIKSTLLNNIDSAIAKALNLE